MILGLPIIELEQFDNLTQQFLILSSVARNVVLLARLPASELAPDAILSISDLRRELEVALESDVVEDVREMLTLAVSL